MSPAAYGYALAMSLSIAILPAVYLMYSREWFELDSVGDFFLALVVFMANIFFSITHGVNLILEVWG